MSINYFLIIGISGISCSGKSTLAQLLFEHFQNNKTINLHNLQQEKKLIIIDQVHLIKQDDYFWPKTSPQRIWIDEIQYCNRENLNSLDMIKMSNDLNNLLINYKPHEKQLILNNNGAESPEKTTGDDNINNKTYHLNILIIEGFLIFIHPMVRDLCQLKIQLLINFEELIERRKTRVYNPATPPTYIKNYVWPTYEKHLKLIKTIKNVKYFDTCLVNEQECFRQSLDYILSCI